MFCLCIVWGSLFILILKIIILFMLIVEMVWKLLYILRWCLFMLGIMVLERKLVLFLINVVYLSNIFMVSMLEVVRKLVLLWCFLILIILFIMYLILYWRGRYKGCWILMFCCISYCYFWLNIVWILKEYLWGLCLLMVFFLIIFCRFL